MKVAIIGSGVSGLLVAYHLSQAGKDVTIFEKSDRIGGCAQTVQVRINQDTVRWVDLGVNDFNAAAYKHIVKMLDALGVPYKDLEDSTAFSTLDGSYAYTIDPLSNTMSKSLNEEYERFKREAPQDVLNPLYQNYSVARYLEGKGYSQDFGRYNLYPRINGMYFVHDTTPETMSFRGIMHYYSMQEGFGGTPERKYFVGGSSRWIEALAQKVQFLGTKIYTNVSAKVFADSHGVTIHTPDGDEHYDAVVMACHATTALRVIQQGITQDMVKVLGAFHYCNSVAIAHTYTPLLPPDVNSWRTYNILIHDRFAQLRPYTISYVCNRHQNDAAEPAYNYFETPKFFVTLNPSIAIPDRYVLHTTDGKPAIAHFPHNVVSLATIAAQAKLPEVQGQNSIYFTGGWTKGAGLHEECWHSAQNIANLILGINVEDEHSYNTAADASQYAPKYLRDVVCQ
ncbi:MAG: FAD-dependent oxidoreductase [Kastovskya adunca ATA6-11-RM4]|jgi:predicted NAD/FAD-binding protein|nr:FAD-dependent oxidoreductase [Kastovskya adunca ATA6-11-RM4]